VITFFPREGEKKETAAANPSDTIETKGETKMLIRYSPRRNLIRRDVFFPTFWRDDFFSDFLKGFNETRLEDPKVEFTENKKNYLLRAEFPGYDKDDIKAEIMDGVLSLNAETKGEKWDQDEDEGWRSIENRRGSYHRSIPLPEDVQVDKIKATMKEGVLRVTLPKMPEKEKETKEITIH